MEVTIVRLLKDGERIAGAVGYTRERGVFKIFQAPAVVLATRAWAGRSRSPATAGRAPATPHAGLRRRRRAAGHGVHPVPPDRHGVAAVGEGHPGDRGRARRGRRLAQQPGQALHVRRHPRQLQEPDRRQPRRGLALYQGDKSARRPPELLTRDHVARCINREVKAGRGSPHGGVYLDIAWIKEKLSNSVEHIKKKLPSMYHQKKLADLDITTTPMEVGPTTHYVMGGVRVDADTQMSKVLGCSPPARRQRHQRRQPAGRQLVERSHRVRQARREYAAKYAKEAGARKGALDSAQVEAAVRWSLAPFDRPTDASGPFQIQYELQELMQENVGIVRREDEMKRALEAEGAAETGGEGRRPGQPGVQPRLVDGAGSSPAADRQRGDRQGGHRAQGEPRRSLPRRLPGQGSAGRHLEQRRLARPTGPCSCAASPSSRCHPS